MLGQTKHIFRPASAQAPCRPVVVEISLEETQKWPPVTKTEGGGESRGGACLPGWGGPGFSQDCGSWRSWEGSWAVSNPGRQPLAPGGGGEFRVAGLPGNRPRVSSQTPAQADSNPRRYYRRRGPGREQGRAQGHLLPSLFTLGPSPGTSSSCESPCS